MGAPGLDLMEVYTLAVSLYFGLPGCGKTTMAAKIAYDAVRDPKYTHVWCNFPINMPGVIVIDNDVIGQYELRDGLLLIDEATIFADSRDYKNFSRNRMEYFLLHRHYNVDIILFTQRWDAVDLKIRSITDRVYYIRKGWLLGHWISTCWRIPYDIIIPDPKKGGDKLGEIIQGYCKPNFLVRLFATRVYRPRYYQYFDSWECKPMEALPRKYSPIQGEIDPPVSLWTCCNKRIILLRSWRKAKRRLKSNKTDVYTRSLPSCAK